MYLVHAFRLREPWERTLADHAVQWSRGFHRPTGLDPDDALWLVVAGMPADAEVALNGQVLEPAAADRPGQFDVTGLVADSSRVVISVPRQAVDPPPEAFPYDVRLGIVGR